MHVQNKRLKLNILLTTYEILLKDKVRSCFPQNVIIFVALGRGEASIGQNYVLGHSYVLVSVRCVDKVFQQVIEGCKKAVRPSH